MKSVHDKILLDPENQHLLEDFSWCSSKGYPCAREKGKNKNVFLHHLILPAKKGFDVDHVDRNPFNNKRSNLRYVTHAQNMMNMKKMRTNTSGFRGVSMDKRDGVWTAQIWADGKKKHIGRFPSAVLAASAYKETAKILYGEFLGAI